MRSTVFGGPHEKKHQGNDQNGNHNIQGLHAHCGSLFKDQYREPDYGRNTDDLPGKNNIETFTYPVKEKLKCFGEGDDIKSYANGLGNKKGEADGGSDIHSEGPGYNKILSPTLNPLVGGKFRDSKGCGNGHQVTQEDHSDYTPEPQGAHCKTKPEKKYGSKYGGNGCKKNRRRTKRLAGRSCHRDIISNKDMNISTT